MTVRILPPEEQARRSRAILALHQDWAARQIAAGVDGPVPEGRRVDSDWNQHVPDLEADGEALDEYFAGLREIIGDHSR